MNSTRRIFLVSASGAALLAAPSERITLGVIGSGGRGTFVMTVFQKEPDLRVGAICDVYEPNLENALSTASKGQGGVAPKAYRNHKQLLDDKTIDAVLIASPEHWHHRMVLDALAAGKDVYIEKPLCHTPESVVVTAEYPEDFIGVFTVNYGAMKYKSRNDQMNHLDGRKARMDIGREDLRVFNQGAEETPAIEKRSEKGFGWATNLHVQNFLECVRSRKAPTAPMWLGFQAALVVQLANQSLKSGRRMKWNQALRKVEV